jgi:hypothetical protein
LLLFFFFVSVCPLKSELLGHVRWRADWNERVLDTNINWLAKFEWGDQSNNGSEDLALMDLSFLTV